MVAVDRSADGTSVPRLAVAGAVPSAVPVIGLVHTNGVPRRGSPLKPVVASYVSTISWGSAGSAKLCQDKRQPACSAVRHSGRPMAARSVARDTGQPTT
jgi:hypothetical protein